MGAGCRVWPLVPGSRASRHRHPTRRRTIRLRSWAIPWRQAGAPNRRECQGAGVPRPIVNGCHREPTSLQPQHERFVSNGLLGADLRIRDPADRRCEELLCPRRQADEQHLDVRNVRLVWLFDLHVKPRPRRRPTILLRNMTPRPLRIRQTCPTYTSRTPTCPVMDRICTCSRMSTSVAITTSRRARQPRPSPARRAVRRRHHGRADHPAASGSPSRSPTPKNHLKERTRSSGAASPAVAWLLMSASSCRSLGPGLALICV